MHLVSNNELCLFENQTRPAIGSFSTQTYWNYLSQSPLKNNLIGSESHYDGPVSWNSQNRNNLVRRHIYQEHGTIYSHKTFLKIAQITEKRLATSHPPLIGCTVSSSVYLVKWLKTMIYKSINVCEANMSLEDKWVPLNSNEQQSTESCNSKKGKTI